MRRYGETAYSAPGRGGKQVQESATLIPIQINYYLDFITCHNAPVFTHVLSLIKPNPCGRKIIKDRYNGCVIYSTLPRFACSTRTWW